jgi:LETM1-like protein
LLRFQLRLKISNLKQDDQKILWEGIESLTKMELREACQERGMRSTGLSKEAYKRNLQQWLDLSVNKDVPISLLIMSRTFFLQEEGAAEGTDATAKNLTGLADAISGLDKEIVNEVILEVATTEEKKSDYEVQKIKLEVLSQQNELIKEEEQALKEEGKAKLKAESKAAAAVVESAKEAEAIDSSQEAPVLGVDPTSTMSSMSSASSVTQKQTAGTPVVSDAGKVVEKEKKVDKEGTLSTEEMDAISHFISQDPVSIERAELEKIKAAMKVEEKVRKVTEETVSAMDITDDIKVPDAPPPVTPEEADKYVQERIAEIDQSVAAMSTDTATAGVPVPPALETIIEEEEVEIDPVVARLKKRVESMVGKIEVQLTNAEEKIGDKLHFLDRDKDGILSREEMAHALQTTLKRELTFEQALQIADAMVGYIFHLFFTLIFKSSHYCFLFFP